LTFIENDDATSLIIAATNHHTMIDRAMFRRFDAIVTFPIPTGVIAERLIRQHLTRRGIQPHPDLDWASVRAAAAGVGHADLVSACDRVSKDAVLAGRDHVFAIDLVTALGERSGTFDTRSTDG
jgi:ATP-dependent 26S proteasome regulatory subunit